MKIFSQNKIIFLILFSLCFFSFAPKTYAGILTKPANNLGLVEYLSFNEGTTTTATDFSGNKNNGTLVSMSHPASATSGWGAGYSGSGIVFDGVNDYVTFDGVADNVTQTSFSISAWVKTTWTAGFFTIWAVNTNAYGNETQLYLDSTNFVKVYDGTTDATEITSSITVGDNKWHHVVYTRSGSTGTLYVDGVSQGTHTGNDTFSSNDRWSLGQEWDAGPVTSDFFKGNMDEVRVYSRVLSQADITALYNSGGAKINTSYGSVNKNGLVGWWTFDGGDVTDKVYDRSGQGNNAYHLGRATSTAKTIGKIGQAFDFDAASDYVRVGNPSSLNNLGPLTYSVWIYPRTSGGSNRGHIFAKTTADGSATGALLFSMSNLVSGGLYFFRVTNANAIARTTNAVVNFNAWNHVAVTWDGSVDANNVHTYINGAEATYFDTSVASGALDSDASNPFVIGARPLTTPDRFTDGKLDDARVYNRVLSSAEIKQIYDSTAGSKVNANQNTQLSTGLNSGLIGYWSLNGADVTDKVYDRSGSNQNGYYNGRATSTAKVAGKIGQGMSFNGSTDSVIVPDSASLDTSTFSVSLWMNADNFNAYGRLVGRWGNTDLIWVIDASDTGELYYEIDTDGVLFGECGANVTSDALLTPKTWYHVVLTYDGTTSRIYRNGTKLNADDPCAGPSTGTARLHFGGDAGEYFQGKLDEIRYYNRALSASEIKQLYLMGK